MKPFKGKLNNTRPWNPDKVRFVADGPARPPWWQAQIDEPIYVPGRESTLMRPDDYVIGLEFDGVHKAYPLFILDYYHIVNDRAGSQPFVLFSCDRCQTGDAWLTRLDGNDLHFYFGGIHNCTLVGADVGTGSRWLIADGVATYGPLRGSVLERVPTYHCTYEEWLRAHPQTLLLAPPVDPAHRDTRHGHGSEEYYARAGVTPLFPRTLGENPDTRLSESAMVLVANVGAQTRIYPIETLKRVGGVIVDEIGGQRIVALAGPRADSFWVGAYRATLEGRELDFVNDGAGFVERTTGSRFNVEGLCESGPLSGKRLELVEFSFLRWHGWAWSHCENNVFESTQQVEVERGPFSELVTALVKEGFDVRVERELINLERPNEGVFGLVVRIDGDRFLLHEFPTREAAVDYAYGRPHSKRSGTMVLESDPDEDLQFADAIHSILRPDAEIPWSPLLTADSERGRALVALLRRAFPECELGDTPLTTLLTELREHGYNVEIGAAQTIDALPTGRWIVETTRSCLRVGCRNAIFGKIDGNPFILYKFESIEAAKRYLAEEKHATGFGHIVFRTTPENMYFLKSGFGQLPDEHIAWSPLFAEKRFGAAVTELLRKKRTNGASRRFDGPPPMTIDQSRRYLATFNTQKGEFVVELAAKEAPITVNNFVFLARSGFYDETTFHMVMPGWFAQGGDPRGDGKGDPGYRFCDEFSTTLKHDQAGIITMANRGAPNTNGSQFLIVQSPMPHMDGRHSAFGRVIQGMDVVSSLTPRDSEWDYPDPPPGDRIFSIRIEELND